VEGRDGRVTSAAADPQGREAQGGQVDSDDGRGASESQDIEGDTEVDIEDEEAQAMIEVVGIDHVQLSMPPGSEEVARAFYVEILGLREIAKPPQLAGRGGCWFVGTDAAIHVAPEAGFRPHAKGHPALVIRDLARARELLVGAGVEIEEDDAGLPVSRCYIRDPFGNRIELDDERDAGFSTV
jgi:catechol 2,3-dioxygenase-like lactoylglutathione lyase family enzyme